MYCIFCGTQLPDQAKFCYNCGGNLKDLKNEKDGKPKRALPPSVDDRELETMSQYAAPPFADMDIPMQNTDFGSEKHPRDPAETEKAAINPKTNSAKPKGQMTFYEPNRPNRVHNDTPKSSHGPSEEEMALAAGNQNFNRKPSPSESRSISRQNRSETGFREISDEPEPMREYSPNPNDCNIPSRNDYSLPQKHGSASGNPGPYNEDRPSTRKAFEKAPRDEGHGYRSQNRYNEGNRDNRYQPESDSDYDQEPADRDVYSDSRREKSMNKKRNAAREDPPRRRRPENEYNDGYSRYEDNFQDDDDQDDDTRDDGYQNDDYQDDDYRDDEDDRRTNDFGESRQRSSKNGHNEHDAQKTKKMLTVLIGVGICAVIITVCLYVLFM